MWAIRRQLNQIYTLLVNTVTNPMTTNLNLGGNGITNLTTINGSPYVPSGTGVTSVNTLQGAITLTGGSDISVNSGSGTIVINGINKPVSNRISSSIPVSISATPITLGTLPLVTTATYDLNAFGTIEFTASSNQDPNILVSLFLSTNGGAYTQIGFSTSITAINHNNTNPIYQISIQAGAFNVVSGNQNIQLRMETNTPITNGAIIMNNFQLVGNGNLA